MKFAVSLLAPIALCLPGAALANDEEPLVFEPTSQWNVDYGAQNCELRRLFSDGTHQLILKIPGTATSGERWMTILVEGLKSKGSAQGESTVEFLPAVGTTEEQPHYTLETEVDFWGLYTPAEIHKQTETGKRYEELLANDDREAAEKLLAVLEEEEAKREKEVTGLLVEGAFEKDLLIKTGAMRAAMNVLRDCASTLPKAWGVEEEAAYPPEPVDERIWLKRIIAAYPAKSLRNREIGNLPVILVIGTDGSIENCIVPSSPASQTLQEETCKNLKRYAKFAPARNEAGEAIRGIWQTTVVYELFFTRETILQ
ncbi:hypothetical protein GRI38_12035 [Altererythrobacter aurantiacus]|uniref:TonB C-terminal domain-containing protein n=1 Tax=Parapontixanthobacter aurantiacus TaxID=1463599 RepID=A0A844ZGU1_9SPHN|nr:energy transducer TonB [Parapontixanthobacter aurantiacus]MXO86754.1 hypothetical protein [Parapontixanthobacter aurantiacus]